MSIQWYPGHMVKARKLIAEAIPKNDVLVEVVDSRCPRASRNPDLLDLGRTKPLLIVMSKSDLSDPALTAAWIRHFEQGSSRRGAPVRAVAVSSTQQRKEARRLVLESCRALAPVRGPNSVKPLRALIMGIPNVGKSTLTNLLLGRRAAQAEDRPGVTRTEQKVVLDDGSVLSDVPGLMWPEISSPTVGLALALCGAIPDTAIDHEPVALFALEFLLRRYPDALLSTFKLAALPASPDEALDAVGRKRGCLKSGGVVDRNKAAGHVLHPFRSGALGRITVEEPPRERPAAESQRPASPPVEGERPAVEGEQAGEGERPASETAESERPASETPSPSGE